MAQGLKPSDNPVKVREFETRLLLVVFPVIYIPGTYFIPGSWCPYLFLFLFYFFFLATHHPHVGVFLFVFYMGRRRGIGKWRRAVGVQRSQVNGLGELLSLFCVVILVYSFFF